MRRRGGFAEGLRRSLPGIWLGVLLCIALIATPAPFATLDLPAAGRVVGRIFAQEAPLSLLFAVVLLLIERRRAMWAAEAGAGSQFSLEMGLALGAVACTVVGYYGVQPMLAAARAGAGTLSFGQLHGVSLGLFGVKIVCASVLSWRALRASPAASSSRS